MFCPKCGTAEQNIESYCRHCGIFLPDFENPAERGTAPEDQLRANIVLSVLTAVISAIFGILLATEILGPDYAARLVRAATIFLWCICIWQISILLRTVKLMKQLRRNRPENEDITRANELSAADNTRALKTADLSDAVPPSIVERTTRRLENEIDR